MLVTPTPSDSATNGIVRSSTEDSAARAKAAATIVSVFNVPRARRPDCGCEVERGPPTFTSRRSALAQNLRSKLDDRGRSYLQQFGSNTAHSAPTASWLGRW
ncbi:hypothetical protein MCNF_19880 [Mycolicibacterium confluentis]|uniref:Uncharacterized protein n=1 Tax=Mycolicibacterium confluentis TaxID=28047 RepID=A0A7I7XWH7_9MYCO|nr:hypothetical protein MCNF_19880 [Mycolicibacterium confluentis]